MKKEHSYNALKVLQIIRAILLIIMSIIVLSTVIVGHCASASNTVIPYIVPNWRNANSCIPDEALQSAEIRYIDDVRNYFGYQGDLSYICFVQDGIINGSFYQIFFITNPTITDNYIDNYDFYNGSITVNSNNIAIIACNVRVSDFVTVGDAINLGWSANLCGNSTTTTLNGGNLTPRYPFYMVGTDNLLSANDKIIFTNIAPVVIPTGHATPPDEFEEPVYPTGSTIPSHVPHLTINNYTWTTIPTPDFSTLESTAESIYHFLQWLGSNLMGALTNLVNNLTNVGNFVGQTIQYYGNLLVKTIQNGITNFYNNMVSLFEPMATAIDYISQPLQVDNVVAFMQSTDIHTDIVSVVNLSNTAFGIFGNVSEPQNFTIPLDLTGISILHQTQPFYINLNWIIDARQYIRAFMWCIVTFGLLYSIVIGIPSMLNDGK